MELKIILFLIVLASNSNYIKVVLSQYNGFPSSFSPGSSFTLPASYGWHKNENGGLSFGSSDVYRPYSPLRSSSQSDRNFDEFGISNERTRNLVNVLEEIKKINWNNEDMRKKIEVFKPRSSNVEWRTGNSDETESTTSRSTSRRTSTTQKTTTRKRTTTKRTTRYTPPPHYEVFHNYGNTFGDRRLLENTYIARKDFFEERPPIGPGPLVKALFSKGHVSEFSESHNPLNSSRWDRYADKRWRTTTKAPYFENKVPAEDKILPASVVTGAATAFGLVSLFPLIVPAFKPLMYCGNINLKQLTIRINDENSYTCNEVDNSFEILCPGNFRNQMNYHCMNKKLQCDLKFSEIQGNVFCRDGILYSKSNMYCTSTTTIKSRIDTLSILECQEGQIASHLGSFIPTTTPSSRHFLTSSTTTTPKPLSFGAKIHLFILKLMGKYDAVNQETTEVPEYPSSNEFAWHPIPLSIPIETTTLTTKINQISSESESKEASEEVTIEEAPNEWMRIVTYPNNDKRLEPVPKQLVEIAEKAPKSEIPADWMKVLISNH